MNIHRQEMHLGLLFRACCPFFSIELLFLTILRGLPSTIKAQELYSPRSGATFGAIMANLRWGSRLHGNEIYHLTGDIHYAILTMWRHPVVLTIHDLRFFEEARGLKRFIFWWLWLYLPCLRANRVTVISGFTRDRLLALCRVNPRKVRVIPNCVAESFQSSTKAWPLMPRILLVGTTPNKNLERVIQAAQGLGVELVVLGQLQQIQRDLMVACRMACEERTNLDHMDVVELYHSCDLVCFVSTYEGFGLPILEAQAVGRPVITSNIAPMSHVAGGGALLVDPFEVASIRQGLQRLLSEPGLREELVAKGFENVKHYSAKAVAAQYAELYREVLPKS